MLPPAPPGIKDLIPGGAAPPPCILSAAKHSRVCRRKEVWAWHTRGKRQKGPQGAHVWSLWSGSGSGGDREGKEGIEATTSTMGSARSTGAAATGGRENPDRSRGAQPQCHATKEPAEAEPGPLCSRLSPPAAACPSCDPLASASRHACPCR